VVNSALLDEAAMGQRFAAEGPERARRAVTSD